MKIEKLLKGTEDVIYGQNIEVNGIKLKKYIPYAEKVGIANRIFSELYEDGIYDYVNGKMFVPVFVFRYGAENIEFAENDGELDIDGIYDYLLVSETIGNLYFNKEVKEVEEIIAGLINMQYRLEDNKGSLAILIEEISKFTPEYIEELRGQVDKLIKDENTNKIISHNFK